MLIVIMAGDNQKAELLSKNKNEKVKIKFVDEGAAWWNIKAADAFFILNGIPDLRQVQLVTRPVFAHSVVTTLNDLKMPGNVSRINAWPTFLQRSLWEVATKDVDMVKEILDQIGWEFLIIPDEPGLVAARIIAMIINEAYFTYGEGISTREEIDIAMKLGTNYPYGPFEWGRKIGLQNIYDLLKALHKNSHRYEVAITMKKELGCS